MTANERAAEFRARLRKVGVVTREPEPPLTTVDAARLGALSLWVRFAIYGLALAGLAVAAREAWL